MRIPHPPRQPRPVEELQDLDRPLAPQPLSLIHISLWLRSLPWLGAILATLFAASTVVSVCYFATFSRSIDIFVFGLMDDDTHAILVTLWHGYPILRTLALLAAVLGLSLIHI